MTAVEPSTTPRSRPRGEDTAATLIYHQERERRLARDARSPRIQSLSTVARVAGGGALALYVFVVAFRWLSAAAGGVASALGDLALDGTTNLLGAG